MKSIAIISTQPLTGKTTIAFNLASAPELNQYQVLLLETGDAKLIQNWLQINENKSAKPVSTNFNFDIFFTGDYKSELANICNQYDYVLIDTGSDPQDIILNALKSDMVAVCTTLDPNEVCLLPKLDQHLHKYSSGIKRIDLIIPNRIHAGEWNNNINILNSIMEYFDESIFADMVPE